MRRRVSLQVNDYTDKLRGFGGNMIQKKKVKPVPQPWYCPEHGLQPGYRTQCASCLRPRVNEYEPGTTILPDTP